MEKMIDRKELCRKLGISESTSYRLVKKGYLPDPIRLGLGHKWSEAAVDEAVEILCAKSMERMLKVQKVHRPSTA